MYTTYYTNGNGSCDNLSLNKYQDQEMANKFYEKNREIFLGNDIPLINIIMMSLESYLYFLRQLVIKYSNKVFLVMAWDLNKSSIVVTSCG